MVICHLTVYYTRKQGLGISNVLITKSKGAGSQIAFIATMSDKCHLNNKLQLVESWHSVVLELRDMTLNTCTDNFSTTFPRRTDLGHNSCRVSSYCPVCTLHSAPHYIQNSPQSVVCTNWWLGLIGNLQTSLETSLEKAVIYLKKTFSTH